MPVEYQGEYRLVGAPTWSPLFSWQTPLNFNWVTTALANGNYEVRVQARQAVGGGGGGPVTRLWSGYFGGTLEDMGRDATVLSNGDAILVGSSRSSDFPVTTGGAFNGTSDAVLMRVTPAGVVVWARYLGGANYERIYACSSNAGDEVVICGRAGAGFPVTGGVFQSVFAGGQVPSDPTYGTQDGFVAKINPSTGATIWASYYGAGDGWICRSCDIDDAGNVYVASARDSGLTIPGENALNANVSSRAGVFSKINPNGTAILWTRYVGVAGSLIGTTPSLACDGAGNVIYLNQTATTTFPVTVGGAHGGAQDMYLIKCDTNGAVLWSRYFGGSGDESLETHNLAMDRVSGVVVIGAQTTSPNLPTTAGVVQPSYGGSTDAFLAVLSAAGVVTACTYLGGTAFDRVQGIIVNNGVIYCCGGTNSSVATWPPVTESISSASGRDCWVMVLPTSLQTILYNARLGGSGSDEFRGIGYGGGYLYAVGEAAASGFPKLVLTANYSGDLDFVGACFQEGAGGSFVTSAFSAPVAFVVSHAAVNTPPPAPGVTTPTNGQVVDTSVVVTLATVVDPEGDPVQYRAEYRLGAGAWLPLFGYQSSPSYNWITAGLTAGSYSIRGFAFDGSAESAAGTVRTFTVAHSGAIAFLSLNGLTVEVLTNTQPRQAVAEVRAVERLHDGKLVGAQYAAARRVWHFVTRPLSSAEFATLLATVAPSASVTVGGDAVGGTTTTAFVDILGVSYVADGLGFRRTVELTIEEA